MSDQTTYTSKLNAKRVLVVGGTSGIGFCAAAAALESGATVIIASSNASKLAAAAQRLHSAYPSRAAQHLAAPIQVDLATDATLEAQVDNLLEQATRGGADKLDHVVYTAGDPLAVAPFAQVTLAGAKQAGNVRFFAPILLAARLHKYITRSAASSLTLTTGSVADKPIANWAVVSGFASGLHGLTRSLALELKPVRVNLVSPGLVETELWAGLSDAERKKRIELVEGRVPTGKVGQPEDLAEVYLYLMKDANVTGQVVRSESGSLLV